MVGKKGCGVCGVCGRKGLLLEILEEVEARRAAAALVKEFVFFEKVKARFCNRDVYNEFIKILNIFNMGIIIKMEMLMFVYDIFGKFFEF